MTLHTSVILWWYIYWVPQWCLLHRSSLNVLVAVSSSTDAASVAGLDADCIQDNPDLMWIVKVLRCFLCGMWQKPVLLAYWDACQNQGQCQSLLPPVLLWSPWLSWPCRLDWWWYTPSSAAWRPSYGNWFWDCCTNNIICCRINCSGNTPWSVTSIRHWPAGVFGMHPDLLYGNEWLLLPASTMLRVAQNAIYYHPL